LIQAIPGGSVATSVHGSTTRIPAKMTTWTAAEFFEQIGAPPFAGVGFLSNEH
jgi:hypothetical protein